MYEGIKTWSTVGERIIKVRKAKGLNQKDFGTPIGLSQGNLSDYEKGKVQVGTRIVRDIIEYYNVNPTWWNTGEGEIFNSQTNASTDQPSLLLLAIRDQILIRAKEERHRLVRYVKRMTPELRSLLSSDDFEGLTIEKIAERLNQPVESVRNQLALALEASLYVDSEAVPISLVDETEVTINDHGNEFRDLDNGMVLMTIPLVPEYAYASYPHGWKDPEYIEELPRHSLVLPKRDSSRYMAFTVRGDSMNDGSAKSICEGDIATGRFIEPDNWNSRTYILVGRDYIIVSGDGIVVKRIGKYDPESGIITCSSINPDKANYPDYEVKLSEVYQVFLVVKVERAW